MAIVYDIGTTLAVGEPDYRCSNHALTAEIVAETAAVRIRHATDSMIRSVSGWRKIFGADENSFSTDLAPEDRELVACIAYAYSRYLAEHDHQTVTRNPGRRRIGIALDSRPTGPAIADLLIRSLASGGHELSYLYIAPTPQLLAAAASPDGAFDHFIMVSASHNPVGYNGFKFGYKGTVLGAQAHSLLLAHFESVLGSQELLQSALAAPAEAETELIEHIFRRTTQDREAAGRLYTRLLDMALNPGVKRTEQLEASQKLFRRAASSAHLGIVIDHNGGARSTSVDEAYLQRQGLQTHSINCEPRKIAHAILPEGESLTQCCQELEHMATSSPGYQLGYVSDNDGDRGTTVLLDGTAARPMEAQEVFALACVARLASLCYHGLIQYNEHGRCTTKVAIVANGPSSLRVDRIAQLFDVKVFRAEVGEANVVALAEALRGRGYLVPILGEASNGGCIIPPAQVRDPLLTVGTLLNLLITPEAEEASAPFSSPLDAWLQRLSRLGADAPNLGATQSVAPARLLALLPEFRTTPTGEERAVVQLSTNDYGSLKDAYEQEFLTEWHTNNEFLRGRFGFASYQVIIHTGIEERHGEGAAYRRGAERGGMKVLFKNSAGEAQAFIWMRPSGTEPVFRVMADIAGSSTQDESDLLDFHTKLIRRAEKRIG